MEPFHGAPHTVEHIKRAALGSQGWYPLRLLSEQVIGRCGPKDYVSEILAIYYWTLANVRYCNDPRTLELVRSPREVIERMQATVTALGGRARGKYKWKPSVDCDDITCLLVGMFLSIGRECRIVTVAFADRFYRGERQYQHVYVQVREPRTGQWIVLDPVAAEEMGSMLRRVKAVKIWPVA